MNINTNSDSSQTLAQAFGFTDKDLAENRQGRLSEAQIVTMRRQSTQIAAIVVGVLVVVGVLSYLSAQPDTSGLPLLVLCIIIPAFVTVLITVFRTEAAIVPRTVSKQVGVIHLGYGINGYEPPIDAGQPIRRRFMVGRMGAYSMIIGSQEFSLTRDQWAALPAGKYAAVYYLPNMGRIVSAELSDKDTQMPETPLFELDIPASSTPALLPPSTRGDDNDNDVLRG